MNQLLNIDDKALIIKNFLPEELFKKIANFKYDKFKSSHKHWEENLYKDEKNILTMKEVKFSNVIASIEKGKIKSDNPIFEEFIKILINCPSLPYQINSRLDILYYEYERLSGINWHDDGKYTINYSFYIHNEWNPDWGGETLIDTGRGLPLVSYPNPNFLLAIKSKVRHKVCPVTGPKKRKVLQIRGIFYE
jgi:Rps23 Pro-64 3,4-dihydroxylase Tpa1-like proline 4-hydroxylase